MDYPAIAWWEHPEQVLWVYPSPHRRLHGWDHYWQAGDRYGVWNDDENMTPNGRGWHYTGAQALAWEDRGDHEVEVEPVVPGEAQVWDGWMLSDDDARAVGLI